MNTDLEQALLALADTVVKDNISDREALLKDLRKFELYYGGYQALFWDTVLRDWRTFENEALTRDPSIGDPDRYAKVINIMRAHVDSITAALTASTPKTSFAPYNPNDPDDITAAEAFSNASKLIDVHNSAPLIFVKILFLLYTQGPIFLYNYSRRDKAYGIGVKRTATPTTMMMPQDICADCGEPKEEEFCESCGVETDSYSEDIEVEGQEVVEEEYEKAREIIEAYGSINVKVPKWITKQSETPYLSLEGEFPIALMRSLYPKLADKIGPSGDEFEKDARRPLRATTYDDTTTVSRMWVRPFAYWNLVDAQRELLEKKFPDGVYLVHMDNLVLEAHPENLDAHWTMLENPMSNRLFFEPFAKPIIPIQQMMNELINITLETVEKGIPLTLIDRDLINLKKYQETENEVGAMIGTKAMGNGDSMASHVFQTRSTSLPAEIPELIQLLTKLGEFVLGSMPGIWGGANDEGSKTFGESEQRRNSALQRLTLSWTMIKQMWNKMKYKACQEFRDSMMDDEEFLTHSMGKSYIGIPIRKVDMNGKVSDIFAETDETFPLTWVEKSARVFDFIGMNNETINTVLFDIENAEMMKQTFGLSDLYIPGLDQRNLQLREIFELLKAGPIGAGQPSIMPDPLIDNAEIHVSTLQNFMASTIGQWHKENNQQGWMNLQAHLQAHQMMAQPQEQAAAEGVPEGEAAPPEQQVH